MFWIHGGGYSGGGSSEPRHNGDFMPTKGVVLVTINYRSASSASSLYLNWPLNKAAAAATTA